MRIATYPDPQGAFARVNAAALQRGHTLTTEQPDAAYVRTLNYGPWRALCLSRLEELHIARVPTIPSYRDSLLYDDKLAQLGVLAQWMPETHVIRERGDITRMSLPFVSKSAQGSASKNVRLVTSTDQMSAELDGAFGVQSKGIQIARGYQRGYLYWQEFIPGNAHDVRVVVCGDNLFGLIRMNRDEVPFASGGGRNRVIASLEDPYLRECFALAVEISDTIGTRWACYDFVEDGERVYVLEVSFSWSERAYDQCPVFGRDLEPNGRTAIDWPEFCVDELERLIQSAT